jgi:predicted phage terminase large subunit-like protein
LPLLAVIAFRGSAKSTIISLSYVLWSIMGSHEMKYILLVGQTQEQARVMLKNIRDELESNPVLRGDLGPFREEEDEWRNSTIVIGNYKAKISAVSVDQSVRGVRHGANRPDLIICDDIEDVASAKTKEGREKTAKFVKGELIPAGHQGTRVIVIGNLVHEKCFVRSLKKEIDDRTRRGVYREYPLLTIDNKCLWPGKYPTPEAIETEKQRVGDEVAWQREYLLRILSTNELVVHPEWIRYYDQLPTDIPLATAIGVDLAISQNDSADCTAMVAAKAFKSGKNYKIYILPHPVNEHLTVYGTAETARKLVMAYGGLRSVHVYVEDVGYQSAAVEVMKEHDLMAKGVKVYGVDKRARLALASRFIESGHVLFPKEGAEELIMQMTGFEKELHDDLADAFSLLIPKIAHSTERRMPRRSVSVPSASEREWMSILGRNCL